MQSLIVSPRENQELKGATIPIKGWAYSGGGRGIVRVEVSVDDGKTWHVAELGKGSEQQLNRAWAWTFFSAEVQVPPGLSGKSTTVLCKVSEG